MKVESLQHFQHELKKGDAYPFYIISSKDEYDRQEGLKNAIHHLFPQGDQNVTSFDGEKVNPKNALDELNSLSLFGSMKAVVITKGEKLKIQFIHQLEKYIQNPNQNSPLILVADGLSATTNFFKKAIKTGLVLHVKALKPWEKEKVMPQWIQGEVSKHNKKIDPQACQMVVRLMGTDQVLLEKEIEKLICYVGDRDLIASDDVTKICSSVHLDTVWKLGDAIFTLDGGTAVKIGQEMLQDGVHLLALLKQLRYQFETKYQLCSLFAAGADSAEVARLFPQWKGRILYQNEQMARSYGMARFKRGLLLIDQTELAAKNSGSSPSLLIEMLLTKLTQ